MTVLCMHKQKMPEISLSRDIARFLCDSTAFLFWSFRWNDFHGHCWRGFL